MVKKSSAKPTKARRADKSSLKGESVEPSSGNVFADLGLRNAEELLAKSELAIEITQLLDKKGWTQAKIARCIGLDRPNSSNLLHGRLSSFSIDQLQAILNRIETRSLSLS